MNRIHRAGGIGHPGRREQSGSIADEVLHVIQGEHAIGIDRNDLQFDSQPFPKQLPGDDVRMMLHGRDEYFISTFKRADAPRVGDQIDRFRGAPRVDDLVGGTGIDEVGDALPGGFESLGRLDAQFVRGPMDIGCSHGIVGVDGLDHRPRLGCRGGTVQIDQRLAVYGSLQNRELGTDGINIENGMVSDQSVSARCSAAGSRSLRRIMACSLSACGRTSSSISPANAWISIPRAALVGTPRA